MADIQSPFDLDLHVWSWKLIFFWRQFPIEKAATIYTIGLPSFYGCCFYSSEMVLFTLHALLRDLCHRRIHRKWQRRSPNDNLRRIWGDLLPTTQFLLHTSTCMAEMSNCSSPSPQDIWFLPTLPTAKHIRHLWVHLVFHVYGYGSLHDTRHSLIRVPVQGKLEHSFSKCSKD